ncbi:carbohydrate-binding protein, partial [Enterococcus faecalis]|uniref:carbohydrate-binding protein n=1 Tax=Enterococcus faecalis TaxID=1351 RepID=UPI003CC502A7
DLAVTTKKSENSYTDYREFKLGSLFKRELYTTDEVVSYQGKTYVSLVTHYYYGDASWNPAEALSLFRDK